ncbi:sensor histidine kinase [Alkalispirochaeta alkalica]|uniref:sensor histidine kinase n=1 Tax=Alkalispirochaeta alkalica TaxID=46356 RepID=UPI000365C629|nr:sensor histidine kinase [Alkalispirochaeta alkalica]
MKHVPLPFQAVLHRKEGPILYRLLLSYSLVGTLPLAVVWLVLLLGGNGLVTRYVDNLGRTYTHRVAAEIDETLERFRHVGERLTREEVLRRALAPDESNSLRQQELDLYQLIYHAIQGFLSAVEVHLTSDTGEITFSSTRFPSRYDLRSQQLRDLYLPEGSPPQSRLFLAPGAGREGSFIILSLWHRLPGGALITDIRNNALKTPLQARTTSKLFLVHRSQFRSLNLIHPQDHSSFSAHPELGIVFSDATVRQAGPHTLVHRKDLRSDDLSVILITDLTTYFATLREIILTGLLLVAVTTIITGIVSLRISRSISRPIDLIVQAMTSDPRGPRPLPAEAPPIPGTELKELALHYNRMVETIDTLIHRVRQEEQALRLAERRALQAQIHPHFLYNTLGSIKSMAKLGDTGAVSSIVTDLGKILRFSLSDTESMVRIDESLDQVQRYLNIQKIRFQERLLVSFDRDPQAESIRIPKLMIQPLVENAVMHGLERTARAVEITIQTRLTPSVLEIRVSDTGPGPIGEEEDYQSGGLGLGLNNVRQRLAVIYGPAATLTLTREGLRTVATIGIPR